MIWLQLIFLAVNILMAWWHGRLIAKDKTIKHGLWGGAYLAAAIAVSWWAKSWQLFILLCLIRKVFFDTALNLFRGKNMFYVSSKTTSIIDKIHYKIFGVKSEIYIGIYLALIVFLNLVRL